VPLSAAVNAKAAVIGGTPVNQPSNTSPNTKPVILSDTEIFDLIQSGMVQGYQHELINPASLDLRLGDLIMLESVESHQMIPLDISKYTAENPYQLVPGQFILAQTIETFNMPEDIAGLFFLKSSRAREGYENLHAGYADPGWHGSALTLELKNARQLQPLPLWPGLKIGQMVFFRMSAKPALSYAVTGSYNNDKLVSASKQFLSRLEVPRLDAAA
jgi:dCTP deaminase